MKKLTILLLLIIPLATFAQTAQKIGTLTVESDTIIRYRVTNPNHLMQWMVKADTLAGTLDGTIELVVANDLLSTNIPSSTVADSLFVRLDAVLCDTLSAVGVYGFEHDFLPYDYVGLKFTLNNITKWHIRYELKLSER